MLVFGGEKAALSGSWLIDRVYAEVYKLRHAGIIADTEPPLKIGRDNALSMIKLAAAA